MSLITGRLDVVMRHEHRAGEKLSVDYAGQTVDLIDQQAGEIHGAQIFIAVMGASSCTFAEATLSQKVEDWIGCQSWFEEIDKPALKQLPSAPYELAYWKSGTNSHL